jgi:hypothetical protein
MKGGKGNEKPLHLLPDDFKEDRQAGYAGLPVPQMDKGTERPEEWSGRVHGNRVFPAGISGKIKTP